MSAPENYTLKRSPYFAVRQLVKQRNKVEARVIGRRIQLKINIFVTNFLVKNMVI